MQRLFYGIAFIVSTLTTASLHAQITNTTSPLVFFDSDCKNAIVSSISKATNSITIACYKLSDPDIVQLLRKAQTNGIRVRIKVDASELNKKRNEVLENLATAEIETTPVFLIGDAHMHNKFAIIDQRILVLGSCNWTHKALTQNRENLLVINDPLLAEKYMQYWDGLQ